MTTSKLVRIALACPFALFLAACADEEQTGSVTIHYELGANVSTCSDEGVTEVRATFKEGVDELETCNDEGELVASNIPAGTYKMFLMEGIDAEGVTVYDSLGDPDQATIKIVGGKTEEAEISLSPTPAQIRVSFNLLDEDGFAYTGQDESPVTEFEVRALDGNNEMLRHTFMVSQLEMAQNNIVPDPGRDINGENLDGVRIDYDAGNGSDPVMVEGGGAVFMFTPPGNGRLVDIIVRCMADVCTGELKGIEEGEITTGEDSATGDSGGTG